MKHLRFISVLLFTAALAFSGCAGDGADGSNGENLTDIAAGTSETFAAADVSFNMNYVPGGIIFPVSGNDSEWSFINSGYWIAETEVTYKLWYTVHSWAQSNGYTFANWGREGNDGTLTTLIGAEPTDASDEPVTTINWRDSIVWCNALTEWFNAKNGTDLTCVYTYNDAVIRDSQDTNGTVCDNTVVNAGTGFRLPSVKEWELAARWRNDSVNSVAGYSHPWFTTGESASGATADYHDTTATGLVSVYEGNSGGSTAKVKSKLPNSLGLYDMSGNVKEWCFTQSGTNPETRGGDYDFTTEGMRIGVEVFQYTYYEAYYVGFRLARSE